MRSRLPLAWLLFAALCLACLFLFPACATCPGGVCPR